MTRAVELSLFPHLRPDKAVGKLIPSVITGNNDELIERIAPMYLTGRRVVDVTYGNGRWWKRYRPDGLVTHDLAIDGVDFTALPYEDGEWESVCFDPPYIPAGGSITSTVPGFQKSFGVNVNRSMPQLHTLMCDGLTETARVTSRSDGFLLVKCQDFVTSGHFRAQSYFMWQHATALGLYLHDEIVHHAGAGPGGHNIVDQSRARRHHSKLLIFTWKPR